MKEPEEQDETKRRFQALLDAKKKGGGAGGASVPSKQDRTTRSSPAKGGRNYRRKV